MDKKHLELFLRETPFCSELVAELWDGLNTLERVNILIHLANINEQGGLSKVLFKKAINDTNSVVRMLAVKSFYSIEGEEPELYEKMKSDKSPFVRAAFKANNVGSGLRKMGSFSQFERLGTIALSDDILEEDFADFIVEGIDHKIISEDEASALVWEFLGNPEFKRRLEWRTSGFEKIWNLTTCTPRDVHMGIVWMYPLATGDGDAIPEGILKRMSKEVLEDLVDRANGPLLDLIKKIQSSLPQEPQE